MYERYCQLRDSKGLKDADVAKATGITKSTFSDWKSGRSKPKYEKLKKIADFLGTTADYIKTGEEKEAGKPNTLAAHFDGDEFTEEELDEIKKFAEYVKSKRKS